MKNTLSEDKIMLKELVDQVSIFGDQKDFNNQLQLFTEQAISETRSNGKVIMELKGRKVMAKAFEEFLKDVDTIYHFNGQSIFTVKGDEATGTCYCLITLIRNVKDKKSRTTIGAVYNDHYVCQECNIGDFMPKYMKSNCRNCVWKEFSKGKKTISLATIGKSVFSKIISSDNLSGLNNICDMFGAFHITLRQNICG